MTDNYINEITKALEEARTKPTNYLEGFVQGYLGILQPNFRFDYEKDNPINSLNVVDESEKLQEEYLFGYRDGMKNGAMASKQDDWIDARQKASLKNKGYMKALEERGIDIIKLLRE